MEEDNASVAERLTSNAFFSHSGVRLHMFVILSESSDNECQLEEAETYPIHLP